MSKPKQKGALGVLFSYAPEQDVVDLLSREYVLELATGVLQGCEAEDLDALAPKLRGAIPADTAASRIAELPHDEAIGALSAEYILDLAKVVLERSSRADVASFIDEVREGASGAFIDPDEALAAMAEGRIDDAAAMLEPGALRSWRGHVQVAELLRRAW